MLRLRYKNDRGEMVSPLLHNQIVTGYATTPDYLIVNCKRSIATAKKDVDNIWSLEILQERILNLPEVIQFLQNNKYEHVVLDKNTKEPADKNSKPKKQKPKDSQEKLEF